MVVVSAAIMPHSWNLIRAIDPAAGGALLTRAAMEHVGKAFRDASVEAIVLAGPHGTRVRDHMCLMDVGRAAGELALDGKTVGLNVPVDRLLVASIAAHAQSRHIPVALAGFGGNRVDQSVAPLDWGGFVPLWFLDNGNSHQQGLGTVLSPTPDIESVPPVVLITPARGLPREAMLEFGRAIGEAIAADPRRIGFVASCDWAHVHHVSGPHGYDPIAPEMDHRIVDAITSDRLPDLMDIPAEDADRAAIDGLWQTLILAGLREGSVLPKVELLSYEAPTYFGMIVALYGQADA